MHTSTSLTACVPPAVCTREPDRSTASEWRGALPVLCVTQVTSPNGEFLDQVPWAIVDWSIANENRRQAKAVWSATAH